MSGQAHEKHDSLWIGGRRVRSAGDEVIEVVSPSTEEVVGRVPAANPEDVDAAVDAARHTLTDRDGWSCWPSGRRAEVLDRVADALSGRGVEMADLVSRQNGIPVGLTRRAEAMNPAFLMRYYADLIRTVDEEERRPGMYGGVTIVRRDPVGVVAIIGPWNMPQTLLAFRLAPALAAGCSVIVKPSPQTVLDAYLLAEILHDAGVPGGVVSVVPGGAEVGGYLVRHPGVDAVAFTGSTAAGRRVARDCAERFRPVTLELGGRSAALILDDADLGACLPALLPAALGGNGELCFLSSRILVPAARYAEFTEAITQAVASLVIGDPLDERTTVGPLISAGHRDRVESYIARGAAGSGRMTTGGRRPDGFDRGWYLQPTVFADVDPADPLFRDEIFGPVLTLTAYPDEARALRMANDSAYGLAGIVLTADPDRGLRLARDVHTGTIGVNWYLPDLTAPFGGVKSSGLGRELGPAGLANYQQVKSIYLAA